MDENRRREEKTFSLWDALKLRAQFKDFYLGVSLVVFSFVLIVWLIPSHVEIMIGTEYAVKPTFFPYAITLVLAFLSILLIYNSPRTSRIATRVEDKQVTWVTIGCMILFFAFFFGILAIGMVPMGILSLFALMKLFGFRKTHWALLFSVIFVLLIFLFFEKIAQVTIPRGVLFEGWY